MFNTQQLEHYQDMWAEFDQKATGFIRIEDLSAFLFRLGSPMGWDESYRDNQDKQQMYL